MDIEKSFWFDITIQYLLIRSIESRWSVCNELLLITVFIWKSIPLSDSPPTSPPPHLPLVSSPLHLSTWLIHPSICSHAPVRLMRFHWHFMLTYSDYCSAAPGGTGGPPSLQHGPVTRRRSLPSQAPLIREQGSWNGFDRIVLHLLRPHTISLCFACHSAAAESTSSLTELPRRKTRKIH